MALTRRQKEVYDFISGFVDKHGYSPSFDEIAVGLGLSSLATVHKHITNLEEKQLLRRDYNRSRSIDLLKPKGRMKQSLAVAAESSLSLPLLGRIAAGQSAGGGGEPRVDFSGRFHALERSLRAAGEGREHAG